MSDSMVQIKYVAAGTDFGNAASYVPVMGECEGFEGLLDAWDSWEREYVRRGFRTINLDILIGVGGYSREFPEGVLGEKRKDNESPVFHAQHYRKNFLGKITPAIDLGSLVEGDVKVGTYTPLSTAHLDSHV